MNGYSLCISVSLYSTFFFPPAETVQNLYLGPSLGVEYSRVKAKYCVSLTQDDDSPAAESCIMVKAKIELKHTRVFWFFP